MNPNSPIISITVIKGKLVQSSELLEVSGLSACVRVAKKHTFGQVAADDWTNHVIKINPRALMRGK